MLAVLAQGAMFDGIPPDGLYGLAEQGRRRTFRAGSQVLRQGEVSESMHIVLRGCVRVEQWHPALAEPIELVELGPGDAVGGIGVLDGVPSPVFVTATEETETLELGVPVLARTVLQFPDGSATLLNTISRHLQSADEVAAEALRKGWSEDRA